MEIGCVVGINKKKGPNYTADAGVWHAGKDAEESEDDSDDENQMEEDNIAVMVQVKPQPVLGCRQDLFTTAHHG